MTSNDKEEFVRKKESVVDTLADGEKMRLDRYLAFRFDYMSRNQWQRSIERGDLTVNGRIISTASYKIANGAVVECHGTLREEPEVDSFYTILFEDDNFIVLNKSGNIPVHPAGRYFNNTLTSVIEKSRKEKLYPVHRIDRETSGIVLFAKNSSSASHGATAISTAQKSYLAVVQGNFTNSCSCTTPIGNAYNDEEKSDFVVRKKRKAYSGADESAVTHFAAKHANIEHSLVEATLETGRLHQIRVHLEHLGYPLVADKIYGGDEGCYLDFITNGMSSDLSKRLGHSRMLLHAHSLSITLYGNTHVFIAPPPDDFRQQAMTLVGVSI